MIKTTIKKIPTLFIFSLLLSAAIASEQQGGRGPGRGHGPRLTDEQKTCLEGKLGPRDSGTRPTREAMEAAFSACGVEKPKGPPHGDRAPQSNTTDEVQSSSTDD